MNTIKRTIKDPANINKDILKEAALILKQGCLVAFPTETVYGLGGNALDEQAAGKIYAAKGRPSDNPLIVHIAKKESLNELVSEIPGAARILMEVFWPGPLTLIFKKSDLVPYSTTGGLDTVAVRMPDDPIALGVIEAAGIPIAAPSANASGRPSPTTADHVSEDLWGKIDMIIDGGETGLGLESTIVDVTEDIPLILRPGYITLEMLEQVLGKVLIDKAIEKPMEENLKPKAPGMKYKHYAPKADLTIYEGDKKLVAKAINKAAKEQIEKGFKVGVIGTDETKELYLYGIFKSLGIRAEEETIAHNLYGVLREFDSLGVDYIYSEGFHARELGQAIMNRLLKAAGYHIEKV